MNSRIRKLAVIAAHPRLWQAALLGVAPTIEHASPLSQHDFRSVIDIGANKGQFACFAAVTWPDAHLDCFEPLPNPMRRLERILRAYAPGRSQIHGVACGSEPGIVEMHIASREDSSSLLPLGQMQKSMFQMVERTQASVRVERLDQVVTRSLARPALLKIDVQGYEYQVLQGATDLLQSIDVIYVEASFIELYSGQRLAPDIAEFLQENGFVHSGQYNTQVDSLGNPIQADFLYRRRDVR